MPTTLPAMKARMGSTDYYVLSMKAQDLVKRVTFLKEIKEREDLTVDERYQQEINEMRVKNQIAPYLAHDESRFFGAVILTAMNFDDSVTFEPLAQFQKVPALYAAMAKEIGFLTFTGKEIFVPLDGQHRLQAIKYAISAKDSAGKPIDSINKPCTALAEDDVTVILVGFDEKKSRKIFTRVNRYAKPTTTGQNIVTDDDDYVAVLARQIANDVFTGRLVNISSNTVKPAGAEFTTLSNIYNCNEAIIRECFPDKIDKSQLPEKARQELYRRKVEEVWTRLTESITVLSDALHDKSSEGDKNRREIKQSSLLGKPVAQECLVAAYLRLTAGSAKMDEETACSQLNRIPWLITDDTIQTVWNQLLWTGGEKDGKMITKNRKLTARIIAYMAGEQLTAEEEKDLLASYLKLFPENERAGRKLPAKVLS